MPLASAERVIVVAERDHRGHWPEDLLLADAQVGVGRSEQRGLHVVAVCERRPVREQLASRAAADEQLGAFVLT